MKYRSFFRPEVLVIALVAIFLAASLGPLLNRAQPLLTPITSFLGSRTLIAQAEQPPELPPLTLESIFAADHSWASQLPEDQTITLIATGDVGLVRTVNTQIHRYGDFNYPFLKTAELLRSGDLTITNLEGPLLTHCPFTDTGMVFCGDKQDVAGLVYAGIDLITLENNHIGNHGLAGINETKQVLNEAGLEWADQDTIHFTELKGIRFAFLAFNEVTAYLDENHMVEQIKAAREQADVVVVSLHWGGEYTANPNANQQRLAHLSIDSGADLILGNHPHWVQAVEQYQDGFVAYAHGNFVFDQMWSRETQEGVVGKYTFHQDRLVDVEFIPILIEDYVQPYILSHEEGGQTILDRMLTTSR